MLIFFTILHVVLAVLMVFTILLQPGKDAGMGAAFGGGAATSAFGGRGAVTFLTKATAGFAVLFFLTSLGLSFVGLEGSVATRLPAAEAPAAPAPAAPEAVESAPAEQAAPTETAPAVPAETAPAAPAPAPAE